MTDTTELTTDMEQELPAEAAPLLPPAPALPLAPEPAADEPDEAAEPEPEAEDDTPAPAAAAAAPAATPALQEPRPAPAPWRAPRAELATPGPSAPPEEDERDFKRRYWRSVLTGNPATVPAEVRKKAGVDELDAPAAQREYRLLSTINRSWAADHLPHTREAVRADWPQQRARIARQLRVRNNEQEVFLALSQESADEPRRTAARRIDSVCYLAGLEGRQLQLPEEALSGLSEEDKNHALRLAEDTYARGQHRRGELSGLAERIAGGMDAFAAVEEDTFSAPRVVVALPDLLRAVDELADMDDDSRNTALYLAAGMARRSQAAAAGAPGMLERLVQAIRRGAAGLGQGMLQGASHASIATLSNIGRLLDNEGVSRTAEAWDKRMQMLERLRHLSQDELRPLVLPGEESEAASYLITAAEQVPAALLSCCGGAGFSALTLGAVGDSVAAARARSPLTDQELQLYAGLLAGSIQAGIYMNLNRVGGKLLEQSITGLGRASGRGVAGYTLAGLNTLGGMTTEAAKLLAAGKLAGAADLGAQEMASRLSRTASNIDWQVFGDNLTDIEANMHEAAGLLPFLLLGSGRLGLQHFRSPRAILGEGRLLERLGVPADEVERIMRENEVEQQTELLREALTHSRIFSGADGQQDVQRALGLLHTDEYSSFFQGEQVRDFLKLPPEAPALPAAEPQQGSQAEQLGFGSRQAEALQIWNEWRAKSPLALPEPELSRPAAALPPAARGAAEPQQSRPGTAEALSLPEREEQIRHCAEDIVRHSYLFLMSVFSVDVMQDFKRDMKVWRASADRARRKLLGEVVKAVAGICDGRPRERSLWSLNRFMRNFASDYLRDKNHFSARNHRSRSHITRILSAPGSAATAAFLKEHPEAQKALDVVQTLHRGVHTLADLAPQMPDFQTGLTRGLYPGQAVTHYLCRILGLSRSTADIRAQQKTRNVTPMKEYSAHNAKQYEIYRRLTGNELEKTRAADGRTYVRGRRVDGSLTHWHETAQQAINDIAGNAALAYTDMGQPAYKPEELSPGDRTLDLMELHEPPAKNTYTRADHGCSQALSELDTLWYGTATSMQPGLNMRQDRVLPTRKQGSPKGATAAQQPTASPIDMAQRRFETAIRRQILSGYVKPLELMNHLVERGYESAEKLEYMRSRVTSKYDFTKAARSGKASRPIDRRANRVLEDVVQSVTRYAVDYFLGTQGALQYPQQVASWVATQAFQPHTAPGAEPAKWLSRPAAKYLRTHLPAIEQVRAAEQAAASRGQDVLSELLEDMMSLRGSRNYEQGWRHYTGGEGGSRVLYGTPQTYWNMLRSPLRTWERLGDTRQARHLRNYVNKFCSQVSFFAEQGGEAAGDFAMQQLDAMLRKYPEMHRYSASSVDEGRLYKMELQQAGAATPPTKRDKLHRGYELQQVDELPPFMTREEGGRACMLLLDHLRSYVVRRPQADASGIWWKNKLYGQFGEAPAGLEEACVSIHPILPLIDKLREAGSMAGSGSPLSICGTSLHGVDPAMKVGPISQVATYRMPGDDTRVYRLMPGDPMLDGTPLRSPYVVQCERGAYIGRRGIVNDSDSMHQACIPLHLFRPSETRITAETQGENWARNSYRDTIESLMSLSWAPGESMAHRSAYVLEYLLRLGEDSGFSQEMAKRRLSECSPEEAALLNLMGDLITTVCAENPAPAMERLEKLAERYRKGEDTMLPRVVDYLSNLRRTPTATPAPRKKTPAKRKRKAPQLPPAAELQIDP